MLYQLKQLMLKFFIRDQILMQFSILASFTQLHGFCSKHVVFLKLYNVVFKFFVYRYM